MSTSEATPGGTDATLGRHFLAVGVQMAPKSKRTPNLGAIHNTPNGSPSAIPTGGSLAPNADQLAHSFDATHTVFYETTLLERLQSNSDFSPDISPPLALSSLLTIKYLTTATISINTTKYKSFSAESDISFLTQPSETLGQIFPIDAAEGYFDGSKDLDLAVANYTSNTVSILIGNGNGTFGALTSYSVGLGPMSVAVGDFKNNKILDVVTANNSDDSLSILYGNGDGTFQSQPQSIQLSPGSYPLDIKVSDINGDGNQDIVVTNYIGTVSVLLGNGNGTFQAPQSYNTGNVPEFIALGDFNKDGKQDIAVSNTGTGANTVSILMGNGNGTFQTQKTYQTGTTPYGIAIGDLNGDGNEDIAVCNSGDNTVSILLGNGDGTFQTQKTYQTGTTPYGIAIGDFNGDGIQDIAVTNNFENTISVLLGNGDGTFQSPVSFLPGNSPSGIVVGDYNNDGKPDLAVVNSLDGSISVMLNNTIFPAVATLNTAEPISFGNCHVGDDIFQALSITNSAPVGSENLDANLVGASPGITTSGSFTLLAAQSTNNSSLIVGLDTSSWGAKSGTTTLTVFSDGAGIDNNSLTSLPSQTVTVTGNVYALAAPNFNQKSVNFGAARVGDAALAQVVMVSNGAAANAFQESLVYGVGSAPSGFSVTSGGSGTVVSGGAATLDLALLTSIAEDYTGSTLALTLLSSGVGTSGLAATQLQATSLTLSGKVYAKAVAQFSSSTLNFGVVHLGDNVSKSFILTNGATGMLTDSLLVSLGSLTGTWVGTTTLSTTSLVASATSTVTIGLNTTMSGGFSGSLSLNFTSHDPDLADVTLASGAVSFTGVVDSFAKATFAQFSGSGSFTETDSTHYKLNFGSVTLGSSPLSVSLGVLNSASGLADLLSGNFTIVGARGFSNNGFSGFSGLAAGQKSSPSQVTFQTTTTGTFTETITLSARGSNTSGFNGTLSPETLTITGNVYKITTKTIANQSVFEQQRVNFTLPVHSFTDGQGFPLTYTAQQIVNGVAQALPSWLSFNAATQSFQGIVPVGAPDMLLQITAHDSNGGSATSTFTLLMLSPVFTTWRGDTNGDWAVKGNWLRGNKIGQSTPQYGDNVSIETTQSLTITHDTGSNTGSNSLSSLTIGKNDSFIMAGGNLTMNIFTVSTGAFTVIGGTMVVSDVANFGGSIVVSGGTLDLHSSIINEIVGGVTISGI